MGTGWEHASPILSKTNQKLTSKSLSFTDKLKSMFGTAARKIQKDPKLMIEKAKKKMAKMDVLKKHNQLPHLISHLKGKNNTNFFCHMRCRIWIEFIHVYRISLKYGIGFQTQFMRTCNKISNLVSISVNLMWKIGEYSKNSNIQTHFEISKKRGCHN